MVKKLLASLIVFSFLFASTVGCGARVPSPKSAHTKIKKHFLKYGKKYKESDFGLHPIDRVEIVSIREIQKGLSETDAYAYLSDGTGHKVRVTFRRRSFGWKVISWENLGPM